MADMGLAFRLSANTSGMTAGVDQAERSLNKVGSTAGRSSAAFRDAAKITREVATPTEKYASTIEKLDNYLERGLVTQEVYGRAVAKADAELQSATSSTEKYAKGASVLERVVNGVSGSVKNVADATTSVAQAGAEVIKFGKDIAWTYLQWKLFSTVKNPAAIGQFALSALKAAGTARTVILAAKAMGVGFALAGGSAGLASGAILGLTNPLLGLALSAVNVTRMFFQSKDATLELAKSVKTLTDEAAAAGTTFQNLSIQKALDAGVARDDLIATGAALSALDVGHLQGLGAAMEAAEKATKRTEQANQGLLTTLGSPFTGLLAALTDGTAALSNGWADLVNGVTSIGRPIGAVLRPFGTLLGTLAEGAMRVVGTLGSIGGVILRVGGLALNVFLSPFIVGLNNTADAIRSGLGAAFDWLSARIAAMNKYLDKAYGYLSKIPILGKAFQSNEGVVPKAGAAGAAAAAGEAGGPAAAVVEQADNFSGAIGRQESALSDAIERSQQFGQAGFDAALKYQTGLRSLQGDLEAGILNETSYAQAAEKLKREFDAQVSSMEARAAAAKKLADEDAAEQEAAQRAMTTQANALDQAAAAAERYGAAGAEAVGRYRDGLIGLNEQLADGRINQESYGREAEKLKEKFRQEQDVLKKTADAQRRRDADVEKLQERAGNAGDFRNEAARALQGRSDQALNVGDVRSAEGMAAFMRLASGRQDPAIAEYQKQLSALNGILAELKALQAAPLEIAGAAGG